jgi:hypothetical protein
MSFDNPNEGNVQRVYLRLMKAMEGAAPADCGVALCSALVVIAYREGYCLKALQWMTRDSIAHGWRTLQKWGLPAAVTPMITTITPDELEKEDDEWLS